jgi:phage terminase large subunit-like protein
VAYEFSIERAEHVCRFIELLPHIKGRWAGQRSSCEPWQIFILTTVFGWLVRGTPYRRFRTVYIEVPRKNAKSTLSSAVALYMLTADREPGAEIYSAATTRDQARIVFNDAKAMALRTPSCAALRRAAVRALDLLELPRASATASSPSTPASSFRCSPRARRSTA